MYVCIYGYIHTLMRIYMLYILFIYTPMGFPCINTDEIVRGQVYQQPEFNLQIEGPHGAPAQVRNPHLNPQGV